MWTTREEPIFARGNTFKPVGLEEVRMTISMSCRPNQLIFCQFLTGNCKSLDSLKITDLLLHRHLIAVVNSAAKEIRRNYSKKVFPLQCIIFCCKTVKFVVIRCLTN